jgi:hypothetical protein
MCFHCSEASAKALWEALLNSKHKEAVMEVRRHLVEAASRENLPIKMSMGKPLPLRRQPRNPVFKRSKAAALILPWCLSIHSASCLPTFLSSLFCLLPFLKSKDEIIFNRFYSPVVIPLPPFCPPTVPHPIPPPPSL